VHDKKIFGHASRLHLKVFFRIENDPEAYNEDDLRAVRDYEDQVQFLNSERERYKTLLRGEYSKVSHSVRENIRKFNGRLSDLLLLKLQVDSSLIQESLKINRLKLFQHTRKLMFLQEQTILLVVSDFVAVFSRDCF
jgi:hypothetical protein